MIILRQMLRRLPFVPLVFSVVNFCIIWTADAFIHSEQMRAGAYIWSGSGDLIERLRRMFDWAALDTTNPMIWQQLQPVHRIRPLSDFVQVVDIVLRPAFSLFYPHPSLSLSALVFAIAAPSILYATVRLITTSATVAALMTALWISSFGFLSIVVPDIHAAAKRSAVLLFLVALYFAEQHRRDGHKMDFAAFWTALLASFFFDEMALGGFALVLVYSFGLNWPKRVALWSLPIVSFAIVNWILPSVYRVMATAGTPPFNAFSNSAKVGVFEHLFDPTFYHLAVSQTMRAILSMLGTLHHSTAMIVALLLAMFGVTLVVLIRARNWLAAGMLVVFLANGFYLVLLDMFPPGGRHWLASYGYYYHSGLGVMFFVWLAFVLRDVRLRSTVTIGVAVLVVAISAFNFRHFQDFNRLVAITHLYPYQPATIYESIRALPDDATSALFTADCRKGLEVFAELNQRLALEGDPFAPVMKMFWISRDDLQYLVLSHFPGRGIVASVDERDCASARR
jgi:hypothetical protein